MIFALSTDDQALMVFQDSAAVLAYCEGIDVADGGWRFWGAAGEPLAAVFSSASKRGRLLVSNGIYTLVPCLDAAFLSLPEMLGSIRLLEPNPYFPSISAIQDHLSKGGSVEHHGA